MTLFLNSLLTLDLSGGDVGACEKEIKKFLNDFEKNISVNIKDSEISRFNAAAKDMEIALSPHVYKVFKRALEIHKDYSEAFNPCMYDLSVLWGFTPDGTSPDVLPSQETLQSYLLLAEPENILMTQNGVYKTVDGVKIDLGGIAKGYAAGVCREIAAKHNITSGIINIAGNIYAVGRYRKNNEDRAFNIAITDPRAIENDNNYFGKCAIENTSISVSGDYERFFILNEKRYCHILDPYTGMPVDNDIISVVAIGENAMDMDAFTTTAMVLGVEDGIKFLNDNEVNAIIITEDKYYICGTVVLSGVENYKKADDNIMLYGNLVTAVYTYAE